MKCIISLSYLCFHCVLVKNKIAMHSYQGNGTLNTNTRSLLSLFLSNLLISVDQQFMNNNYVMFLSIYSYFAIC